MNINFNDVDYVKHNNLDINAVKLNDEEIWRVGTTVNGVPPLTLSNATDAKLKKYKIYGNSVQDGTPTPDSPVEIECVGDLTKNLFSSQIENGLTINISTSQIAFGTTQNSNKDCTKELIKVSPNTKYTFTFNGAGTHYDGWVCGYGSDKLTITDGTVHYPMFVAQLNKKSVTFTTTPTTEYIGIYNTDVNHDTFVNPMLEEGTTATDYEPYHKYKIPVLARGRNLIKLNTKSYSANGGTITNNQDGTYTLSGTPTGYCGVLIGSIPSSLLDVLRNNVCVLTGFYYYEKNVRITLNVKLNGSYIKYIYLNPYTYKNYVQVDLRTTEFDEITFALSNQKDNVDFENVTVKPLLEVGTTMPTSFEPYIAPITTNIFLNEPLRKVGDYADYVDFEKQKVVRKVEEFDSLRANNFYSWNNRHGIVTESVLKYTSARLKGMSNRLNVFTANGNETCTFWLGVGNRVIYWVGILDVLGIYSDSKTSKEMIEGFNTWLANNPTYVIYPLTIPTEESVTLPALPQFKGTTIYEVGTNIQPSNMSVTYIKN